MSRIKLAKFRKNASHKKCSRCKKLRPGGSFARQKRVCLECRNERQIDILKEKNEIFKKASGGCWWLERYFIISSIEISKLRQSYR